MGSMSAVIGDRYRILAKVGEGGVTEDLRALDMRLNRTVALRTLREAYLGCPYFVQSLEDEARALARVPHRNIVRVYDYSEAEKRPFIVMEYVPGKKLTELLSKHSSMPEGENDRLAWQLMDGLFAVRRAGLVCGTIPLHNVLVNHDGVLKLTGFGTGTSTEAGGTDGAGIAFSAPQCCTTEAASHHDLHVVGSMLRQFLSGVLVRESERWLDDVARGVDVMEWTPQREAEVLWPSDRHVPDAVLRWYRASEKVAAPRAAGADPTRAFPLVTASYSESDTIRLPTIMGAGATRAAMAPRRSTNRSLLSSAT